MNDEDRTKLVAPAPMRLLVAIFEEKMSGRTITVRSLGRKIGRAIHAIEKSLLVLKRNGLVGWDCKHVATIQPTCRLVMFAPAVKKTKRR